MGEVAKALLDGSFDYITGEYIGEPVGYPRTKRDLKDNYPKRCVNGIKKYLLNQRVKNYKQLINDYTIEMGDASISIRCVEIQRDFDKFCKFVKKNKQYYEKFNDQDKKEDLF